MSKIEVYNNFLSDSVFKDIKNVVTGSEFPWFYIPSITTDNDELYFGAERDYMFLHMMWWNDKVMSNFFPKIAMPLIGNLKYDYLWRVKINAYPQKEKPRIHKFHIDDVDNKTTSKVALFSINTNNGYTEFEDGRKFDSIENRLILFDGNLKHRSVTQTDTSLRINVNLNIICNGV